MRGTYRGEERALIRREWAENQIPFFLKQEILPIGPFLEGKNNIIAIDAGANKGLWTKALFSAYGDRVKRSYMIDASPENVLELKNTTDNLVFDLADFDRIETHHFAVGEKNGTINLYTNEDGSPLASVHPHTIDGRSTFGFLDTAIAVPLKTLDNFLAENPQINHIDVLKLDVEGNELHAMRGSSLALSKDMIDIITFEFGLHQVEPRHFFRDFWELLTASGFNLFLNDGGTVWPILQYEYKFENFTDVFEYIAIKNR